MNTINMLIDSIHDNFHKKFEISYENQIIPFNPRQMPRTGQGTMAVPRWPFLDSRKSGHSIEDFYKPICLTLYLHHQCNLSCGYCYDHAKPDGSLPKINVEAVERCAGIVASNCAEYGTPFILGFHGGNEPLLHPRLVQEGIEICRDVAQKYGLNLLTFCTTNGVVSDDVARWAGETFYGITLSWDGPPEIHDRWRRQKDNRGTGIQVERTAELLRSLSSGRNPRVRCTVTRESAGRLVEITQYFYEKQIGNVEFYPVFGDLHHKISPQLMPDPAQFVKNFLMARAWGERHRMAIGYAGSRMEDYHDRFCPVFQNNLTLTPDGCLTACFLATHNRRRQNEALMYGCFDGPEGKTGIDFPKLIRIFQKNLSVHPQCSDCFNFFHCAKGCPGYCPVRGNGEGGEESLDCTIERWMGLANIIQEAGYELPIGRDTDCEKLFNTIRVKTVSQG